MLFSVIIPTYNRAALLLETLESVFAQTLKDYEILLVDDGSTDGTADLVRGFDGQVRLIAQARLGAGPARNAGAKEARGDYLAFLDSDDLWFPWTLASFAELIRKYDRPAILTAKVRDFSGKPSWADLDLNTPLRADIFTDHFASSDHGYFVGGGMAVLRREIFLQVGGYTHLPINLEDHDLILRLGEAGGFVQVISPVTLARRCHSDNGSSNLDRNVAGCLHLLGQERRGAYAGGSARRWQRRKIITRHIRPVSLACLREGATAEGWRLYRDTFNWHVRLGRWKYLAGFPLKAFLKT